MNYTGILCPKEVPFSGRRYGKGVHFSGWRHGKGVPFQEKVYEMGTFSGKNM